MGSLVHDPSARIVETYEDESGQWRWRVRASANGKIVYTSGESYSSKSNARRAINTEFGSRRNFFIREVKSVKSEVGTDLVSEFKPMTFKGRLVSR